MPRLPILKTYKLLIDGKFERSESGRSFTTVSGNMCRASRKDFRNAVVVARGAGRVALGAAISPEKLFLVRFFCVLASR